MLSPYRVLDLTDERGHLAGLLLAQLGADVVAIEPVQGQSSRHRGPFAPVREAAADYERSLSHWAYNRGKRSVVLDLVSSEKDRASLRGLAAGADFLIESGRPGELSAIGLGYDALKAINPGLIYVSISAFGQSGPKAHYESSDLIVNAAGGYLALTGDADRAPVRVSLPQAYQAAAADAAGAAVIALFERQRSSKGQHVDISAQASMLQCTQSTVLAAALGAPIVARMAGGVKMPPFDLRLVWPCKDGHVTIAYLFGTSIGPFTARLMAWICEDGFCDTAMRDKDWVGFAVAVEAGEETIEEFDRAKATVTAWLLTKTKAELLDAALTRRLLIAPITTVADVLESPQLAARDYWESVECPSGQALRFPGAVVKVSSRPLIPLAAAPTLGRDTAAVLAEQDRSPAIAPSSTPSLPRELPLRGLKVLDFMWAMAGPATTRSLADYGATVIRVESVHKLEVARGLQPFVDGTAGLERSGLFLNLNAGKKGLALDMSKPEAREVILDLVRWADLLCESFSPRAMKAWGLSYETLREVNPKLVMLSSCLMGQTGPLAMFAGFGNLAAAISGFYHITGWPDRDPSGPFSAYTDYYAPRVTVPVVLAAVDHARRTGEGAYLDYSQGEAAIHVLAPALLDYQLSGNILGRHGNRDPYFAPHGVFPCSGVDRWIAIAITNDAQWSALATQLRREDLSNLTADDRLGRVEELEAMLSAWTAPQEPNDVETRLQNVAIPAYVVQNSPEAMVDTQLAHREHFVKVDHTELGSVLIEGSRYRFSDTPATHFDAAPTLGEHTFEILTDILGYDVERVADLAAAELLE